MSAEPFDVVVVPFPYSDRLAEKRRPALVVSAPAVERALGRVWVAMITSAVEGAGFADTRIEDLHAAGLPAPSLLRASKIATIDADRILRRVGALSTPDRAAAERALRLCSGF
jgi:mRNA interferase MazF